MMLHKQPLSVGGQGILTLFLKQVSIVELSINESVHAGSNLQTVIT